MRTTDAGGRGIISGLSYENVDVDEYEDEEDKDEDEGDNEGGDEEDDMEEEKEGAEDEDEDGDERDRRPKRIVGSKFTRINACVPSGIRS